MSIGREAGRCLVYGLPASPFIIVMIAMGGPRGVAAVIVFAVLTTAAGAAIRLLIMALQGVGEGGVRAFFAVSGKDTPAEADYSMEQSLAERGDVAGALSLYEARFTSSPDDAEARLRAAELYARAADNPRRAAELFNEARRIAGATPQRDLYATNRLIDLYTGPLATPARALGELRRLIDRYPNSAVGAQARATLATLKAELQAGVESGERTASDSRDGSRRG